LAEGCVQAHDVWYGHDDEDKVEEDVGDGAAEVYGADRYAFGVRDGDVPGRLNGDAVEYDAEELWVSI